MLRSLQSFIQPAMFDLEIKVMRGGGGRKGENLHFPNLTPGAIFFLSTAFFCHLIKRRGP